MWRNDLQRIHKLGVYILKRAIRELKKDGYITNSYGTIIEYTNQDKYELYIRLLVKWQRMKDNV